LSGQIASELLSQIVEQQRVLTQLLRKQTLRQAWRENNFERSAPGLMRAADKDPAVAIRRRFHLKREKAIGENIANFHQRNRSDSGHGSEIGQHPEDVLRLPQDAPREAFETLEPIAPSGLVRPLGYRLNQW
jgi:hypothetical protein